LTNTARPSLSSTRHASLMSPPATSAAACTRAVSAAASSARQVTGRRCGTAGRRPPSREAPAGPMATGECSPRRVGPPAGRLRGTPPGAAEPALGRAQAEPVRRGPALGGPRSARSRPPTSRGRPRRRPPPRGLRPDARRAEPRVRRSSVERSGFLASRAMTRSATALDETSPHAARAGARRPCACRAPRRARTAWASRGPRSGRSGSGRTP
jgi:hypothetical protein